MRMPGCRHSPYFRFLGDLNSLYLSNPSRAPAMHSIPPRPQTPLFLSLTLYPASSKQMGPGLAQGFFLLTEFPVPAPGGFGLWALGSGKRLETIVLFWRYINKIELMWPLSSSICVLL